MVTLFSQQIDTSRRPASLVASAFVHAGIIGLVSFGIFYSPKIDTHFRERFTVRQLDLSRPADSVSHGVAYPGPWPNRRSAGKAAAQPPALMETAHARPGPQTLVQPDLPEHLAIRELLPVPQALIWSPRIKVVKKIVAPTPEPPTVSTAKPSFAAPNQEVNVSDVDIASSSLAKEKLNILPSTSSPVMVQGNNKVELPPATVSQVTLQPTPTALLSLSNLRMEGTATLPPVNESALKAKQGVLAGSTADAGAGQGNGTSSGNGAGKGAGQGAKSAQNMASANAPQGQPTGTGQGDKNTSTNITLPKGGQFGSVVMGDSLQDEYPELSGVWNGRMAYTVYLHVGLAQSWILQYSLPANANLNLGGNADRLDAPWPYSIVRPNLGPGVINADALMVHGYVNSAGRFESLSIICPDAFPQAQFVLSSLEHWQFRPATENGQVARVEVLLIIPEELE